MLSDKLSLKPYQIQANPLSRTAERDLYLAKLPYSQQRLIIRWEAAAWSSPEFRDIFLEEKKRLSHFQHPYIPPLLDFGEQNGRFYTVYPYLSGFYSLADELVGGFLPLEKLLRYTEQIASALDYAHQRGVAHRGLEPQRIWFDHYHNLYVGCWGRPVASASALRYASPAQFRGQFEIPSSDIYALGVMLYHMLTGYLPYSAPDESSLAYQMEFGQPATPYRGEEGLGQGLEAILTQAFEGGYQRAGDLAEDLSIALGKKKVLPLTLSPAPPAELLWSSAQTGDEAHQIQWNHAAQAGLWLPNEGLFLVGGADGILYRGSPSEKALSQLTRVEGAIRQIKLCGYGEHQAIALLLDSGQISLHKRNGQPLLLFGEKDPSRVSLECTLHGDIFLQGTNTGDLIIYNILDLSRHSVFRAHDAAITVCTLNGQLLAVGGADGLIKLWSWQEKRLLQTFEGHSAPISALELKGELVFSGAENGELRVWDILMQDRPLSLGGHRARVTSCQMFEGGRGAVYGLSGGLDGTARLWDLRRGVELERYPHPQGVNSVALAGDDLLLTGESLRLLDLGKLTRLSRHESAVRHLQTLDETLLSVGDDSQVVQTQVETGSQVLALRRRGAACLLAHQRFVWLGYQAGIIQCWDWERQNVRWEGDAHQAAVNWMLWREDDLLISGGQDGMVESRNALLGARHDALAIGSASVRAGVLYQGQLVLGTQEGVVASWDLERGECLHIFAETGTPIMTLCAQGDALLAGLADGRVLIWENGQALHEFQAHRGVISATAWQADQLITADLAGQVRLWNWQSPGQCGEWAYASPVLAMAWAQDGTLLLGEENGNLQRLRL